MKPFATFLASCLAILGAPAGAQNALDRAAPDVIQSERPPAPQTDVPTPPPAVPDAPDPAAPVNGGEVFVGAIRVVGADMLGTAAFAPAIEPFVGRTLGRADRQALVEAVTAAARARGLVLATATIEPQPVGAGVLRVRIEEGRIGAIRLSGDSHPLAEQMLAPLAMGAPVTLGALERRLLLVGDIAGVSLRDVRIEREGGINILAARLVQNRLAAAVSIDNWGTGAIGPVEAQATVEGRSLVASGDELGLVGAGTPLEFNEYRLGGLRYTVPVDDAGTTVSASTIIARTEPGGRLARFDTLGDSVSVRATLRRPLLRRQAASLWGSIGLHVRDVRQDQRGKTVRADRVTDVVARLNGEMLLRATRVAGSLWLSRGLALFDATAPGDPRASRDDADGRFTKAEARLTLDTVLADPLILSLAGEAQLATRPLLSGDEMGLGGPRFLRGYDYRERSGDQGVAGSAELRLPVAKAIGPVSGVEVFAYADTGRVWNLKRGRGGGALSSAGGGVRAAIGPVGLAATVGVPLSDEREESDDRSPRLSFEAYIRF